MRSDILDPVVWKYSAASIMVASAALVVLGHVAFEAGASSIVDFLSVESWLPPSWRGSNVSGFVSGAVAFLAFSFAMPWLSAILLPMATFFQVLLVDFFVREFQAKHFQQSSIRSSAAGSSLWVFGKWTLLKMLLFLLLLPLFHLPLFGWAFHLFLSTLWITMLYFDLVGRRYFSRSEFWAVLRANFAALAFVALSGVVSYYAVIWALGSLGLMLPPFRALFLFVTGIFVITGNFVLSAEFVRFFEERRVQPATRLI